MGGDDPIEVRLKVATLERRIRSTVHRRRLPHYIVEQGTVARRLARRLRWGCGLPELAAQRADALEQRQTLVHVIGVEVVETAKLNAQHGSVVSVQRHVQLRSEPREYLIQVIAVDRNGFAGCECPYDVAVAVGPATEISE